MAAMVDLINRERKAVIITLERPIEYIHTCIKSVIKQREIGVDTNSFSSALQASLRQDPNVIVVGELEDTESVKTAFIAAEAGYLVIASFHAPNTTHAIDRLASIFPADNRRQVLVQISNCLRGIITQVLIPTKDRAQRLLASEVLIANDAVKRLIRSDELIQLPSVIQTGKQQKMQGIIDSVKEYLQLGLIDKQTALFYCKEFGVHASLLAQFNEQQEY
jgi:twitching motility protein PilT